MLEKAGVWSHLDRVILLAFFSTALEEYWKGEFRARGTMKQRKDRFLVSSVWIP